MDKLEKEQPLHPTPMEEPMMKGKIYVDASQKPTVQVRLHDLVRCRQIIVALVPRKCASGLEFDGRVPVIP